MAFCRRPKSTAAISLEDWRTARALPKNAPTKKAKVTRRGRNGSAATNAKHRSKKKTDRKLAVSSHTEERQESLPNSPIRGSFSLFPKLPVEIQHMIWSLVSLQTSPRVLYIAPDPSSQYKTIKVRNTASKITAWDGPRMELLPDQSISISPLFSVCRDTRTAALKEYTAWEKPNPKLFSRTRKTVYVNKAFDIFYFENYYTCYWFLDLLCHNKEVLPREQSALQYYLDQFSGIRNLAFHCGQWNYLMTYEYTSLQWLRHLPSLRVLTIVIDIQSNNHWRRAAQPGKRHFVSVTPNTVRAESEKIIVWFWRKHLERLYLKYPEYVIPEVEVVSYSAEDDCSSQEDQAFRKELDMGLKFTAEREFGESW